ncbi:MAG TPA: hypothetical protein PKW30_02760 [Campylobacterales bacterium]|nr:hypothetical protein [Campylobacterales bacterium]
MLPLLPFIVGAAVGVAGVMIYGDKRTKKKLIEGRQYIEGKYEEGKESVVAITECVKEKMKSNKPAVKKTRTTKKAVANESKQ